MPENNRQFDRRSVLETLGTAAALTAMAGCTGGTDDGDDGGGDGDGGGDFRDITALGGITGGSGYQHCLAFQQVIEGEIDNLRVTVSGTDGWGWNATNMYENGRDDMGIVPAGDAYEVVHGEGDYSEEKNYIAQVYPAVPPTYLHAVTLEETGIEEYEDMEGARVNVLPRGTLSEQLHPVVMDALGIEPAEFLHFPHEEAASALQQGDADVAVGAGTASPYMELSQTEDVRVVPLREEQKEPIMGALPWIGFAEPDFSELGYEGANVALVPAPWTVMAGLLDLDNDLVYDLLDALYNNIEKYVQIYNPAEGLAPERAVDANIPLHPGALEYYEDQGVDIPDRLRIESADELPLEG